MMMLTGNRKNVSYQRSAEIVELATAFENCTLPPEKWTHEVFLTVAFWYLFFNSQTEAQLLFCNAVRRYNFEHNIARDAPGGYHETLMLFWLRMVKFYLERFRPKHSFLELANDIVFHLRDKNLPFRFYSKKQLFSAQAKSGWVEPDLNCPSAAAAVSGQQKGEEII